MSFANHINLTNMEIGLIIVEGSVLLSLFISLICFRRMVGQWRNPHHSLSDSDSLREWVRESEAICQGLSRNLEEKREIVKRLIGQLEEKIRSLDSMAKRVEEEMSSISPKAEKTDMSARIHEMAEAGCDVSDIARELRLSKGEVQLALDLRKYCQ